MGNWTSSFIVYRFSAENVLSEVFHSNDLSKAKYWIRYIAEKDDVLCRTPKATTYAGTDGRPQYLCHKEARGKSVTNEKSWSAQMLKRRADFKLPCAQMQEEVVVPIPSP